jgi:hypothetical protein
MQHRSTYDSPDKKTSLRSSVVFRGQSFFRLDGMAPVRLSGRTLSLGYTFYPEPSYSAVAMGGAWYL